MNREREFEQLVGRMRDETAPPATPRERMWEKIAAARAEERPVETPQTAVASRPVREARPWWRLAAAAVAILVLGVAAGRMLPREGAFGPAPVAENPVEEPAGQPAPQIAQAAPAPNGRTDDDLLYQAAAVRLFGQADALLTGFKTASCDPTEMEPVPGWANDMLTQTRLLLGAGRAAGAEQDSPLRQLLLDLELTLVQISGLTAEDCRQETEWIRAGMEKRSTVERVRLMAVAGTTRPL